jgi:single-strand DNA-binding protein
MAGSINKVILVGNLGRDPEVRHSQDGNKIVTFPIATSETWKDKSGEKQDRTEWHRIVVFSPGLADVCEKYLKKGSKVYLEGQLRTRKWTDSQGIEKYSTEIVLSGYNATLVMLDSKGASGGGNYSSSSGGSSSDNKNADEGWDSSNIELDDDIPF